jgi:hypothetical protein
MLIANMIISARSIIETKKLWSLRQNRAGNWKQVFINSFS